MPNLPIPSDDALAHSLDLQKIIITEIQQKGAIPFQDFMQLALYEPKLGYYRNGSIKFGATGDFTTAPEISPLFAQCIAKQYQQVAVQIEFSDILEFGAGSGVLAVELLKTLQSLDCLPEHYYILELSAELQQRQQQRIRKELPKLASKVCWLTELPKKFVGMMLANEVLDAMPTTLFQQQDEINELHVDWDGQEFTWQPIPSKNKSLIKTINELSLSVGYQSEYNPNIQPWINSLSQSLQQGLVLLIDYGFPRHEYYHPDRNTGTLMCHYQHHAHPNPLILCGIQDITAHVDFTAVAEAATECYLSLAGYTNQAHFLLNCGLTDLIDHNDVNTELRMKLAQQAKRLTLPGEMGELFKVMALSKRLPNELIGFKQFDMRHKL